MNEENNEVFWSSADIGKLTVTDDLQTGGNIITATDSGVTFTTNNLSNSNSCIGTIGSAGLGSRYFYYPKYPINFDSEKIKELFINYFYEAGFKIISRSESKRDYSKKPDIFGWIGYGIINATDGIKSILYLERDSIEQLITDSGELILESDESVFFEKFRLKIIMDEGYAFISKDSEFYLLEEEAENIIQTINGIFKNIREATYDQNGFSVISSDLNSSLCVDNTGRIWYSGYSDSAATTTN